MKSPVVGVDDTYNRRHKREVGREKHLGQHLVRLLLILYIGGELEINDLGVVQVWLSVLLRLDFEVEGLVGGQRVGDVGEDLLDGVVGFGVGVGLARLATLLNLVVDLLRVRVEHYAADELFVWICFIFY